MTWESSRSLIQSAAVRSRCESIKFEGVQVIVRSKHVSGNSGSEVASELLLVRTRGSLRKGVRTVKRGSYWFCTSTIRLAWA